MVRDYRLSGRLLLLPHFDQPDIDRDALELRRLVLSEAIGRAANRATFEDPPRCLRCDTSCKAPVVVQLLGERLSPSAAFRSVAT